MILFIQLLPPGRINRKNEATLMGGAENKRVGVNFRIEGGNGWNVLSMYEPAEQEQNATKRES